MEVEVKEVEPVFGEARARMISVVKRGNTVYYRAYPESAIHPSEYQMKARSAFGHAAEKAKGKTMDGLDLPPACYEVKKLKGLKFGNTRHWRKWETLI